MRIFLTGNAGYFGSVVHEELLAAGHEVTGCDAGFFDVERDESAAWDVRDVTVEELRGHDAVVHLAGLSNDAAGELSEEVTVEINQRASIRLAWLASKAGVERFVFASSCSVYGAAAEPNLTEDGIVRPLTAYAHSKLWAERAIVAFTANGLCPTALRFATLYGPSPAFRNDLLVNRMTSTAWRHGQVTVTGDGSAERPLLHVRDAASAILETLSADSAAVFGEVFNVGVPGANYSLRQVADLVTARYPDVGVRFTGSPDRRSYTVCFDRFTDRVDGWRPQRTVEDGVAEVAALLNRTAPFPRLGTRWGPGERSSWLAGLIRENVLTDEFRWTGPLPAVANL
ncbi:SDR family oxidoreductase [Actinophytocola sp.]|uniref:NAD-dependent epimerase/dehydratase family protein n=1 Tax=Actinophytocola sp. TaxID=1872138 RepID=UPI002ED7F481